MDDGKIASAFIIFYTTHQRKLEEMKCKIKRAKERLKVTKEESSPQVENIFTSLFTIEERNFTIVKAKFKKSPRPDKILDSIPETLGTKISTITLKTL